MSSDGLIKKIKRFTKMQLMMLGFSLYVLVSPAKAAMGWDAEIILQYLITSFNYIMDYVNDIGFNLEQYYERLGSMAEQNAQQQSTEVLSGVIAEETKILGKTQLELQYLANNSVSIGGKEFVVGAISTTGCATKRDMQIRKDLAGKAEVFKENAKVLNEELINSESYVEEQRAKVAITLKNYYMSGATVDNATNPAGMLSDREALDLASVSSIVANKKFTPKGVATGNWTDGGEVAEDYYKRLTGTVSSVFADSISKSIAVESEGKEHSANSLVQTNMALANSYARTKSNNFKLKKGVMAEHVENTYRQIQLRLENLNQLRQQERLYAVIALKTLNQMHRQIGRRTEQ